MTLGQVVALACAGIVMATGTSWAFVRGGNDFNVFYEAWRLVLSGEGARIYGGTPDRFLYAPGFAWLLSPLALIPRDHALAAWCFAKVGVVALMVRGLAIKARLHPALAAAAVLVIARPLLIDFQYGQVNVLVMGGCFWALVERREYESSRLMVFVRWAVLGASAACKLFPLPLALIPWVSTRGIPRRQLRLEKAGLALGLALVLLLPAVTEGYAGLSTLLVQWSEAVLARGFPLETHNQSFLAAIHHYFSGMPTPIIAQAQKVLLGAEWISTDDLRLLGLAWSCITLGLAIGWSMRYPVTDPARWTAILVGMLILPSHLVWKPYFVMTLPMAVVAIRDAVIAYRAHAGIRRWIAIAFAFVVLNLTGFDFIGPEWAGRIEAASAFLIVHLSLMVLLMFPPRRDAARDAAGSRL